MNCPLVFILSDFFALAILIGIIKGYHKKYFFTHFFIDDRPQAL